MNRTTRGWSRTNKADRVKVVELEHGRIINLENSGWGHGHWMVNHTTEEQTKEINTVLNSLKDKYGGERESFDA